MVGTAAHPGAAGGRATTDHLRAALAWAEAEHTRAGSPLNGKIALDPWPSWVGPVAGSSRWSSAPIRASTPVLLCPPGRWGNFWG